MCHLQSASAGSGCGRSAWIGADPRGPFRYVSGRFHPLTFEGVGASLVKNFSGLSGRLVPDGRCVRMPPLRRPGGPKKPLGHGGLGNAALRQGMDVPPPMGRTMTETSMRPRHVLTFSLTEGAG